jgi:hypothetical protein
MMFGTMTLQQDEGPLDEGIIFGTFSICLRCKNFQNG